MRRRQAVEDFEQNVTAARSAGEQPSLGGDGIVGPSPAGFSANSPPSTATSVVGKVLAGFGMGRFFGVSGEEPKPPSAAADAAVVSGDAAVGAAAAATAAGGIGMGMGSQGGGSLAAPSPSSQATGPAPSAATGASLNGAGGSLRTVTESPASAAARVAAASAGVDPAVDVDAAAAAVAAGRNATTDDFQTTGGIPMAPSDPVMLGAGGGGGGSSQHDPNPGPRGSGPIEGAAQVVSSSIYSSSDVGGVGSVDYRGDPSTWSQQQQRGEMAGGGVAQGERVSVTAALAADEAVLRGRGLGPAEAQAYADNVDRTLQVFWGRGLCWLVCGDVEGFCIVLWCWFCRRLLGCVPLRVYVVVRNFAAVLVLGFFFWGGEGACRPGSVFGGCILFFLLLYFVFLFTQTWTFDDSVMKSIFHYC